MRTKKLLLMGFAAFALLMIGCGGGGGQASSTGSTGATTGGGGNLNLMPPAQRAPILAQAQAAFEGVPEVNGLRNTAAVLKALQGVAGLKNLATTFDGSVIATFADGLPISFLNNNPTDSHGNRAVAQFGANHAPIVRDQPGAATARLLDSEDPILFTGHTNDDASMFNAHGYPGTTLTVSSVEAFKALGGSPVGCLYIAGHGGSSYDPKTVKQTGYGIWTATNAGFALGTAFNAGTYAADMSDGSLAVAIADNHIDPITKKAVTAAHYMILPHFVTKYHWNLTNNSFVSVGACDGASADAANFRSALFAAGASVIAAWTDATFAGASYNNNSYLLDRMLGANVIETVSPPRRPFSWQQILPVLTKRGTVTYTVSPGHQTTWTFFTRPNTPSGGSNFTSLNPTLESLELDASTNSLLLLGDFGADIGKVFVGSNTVPITSWTSSVITCTVPASGDGSAGDVFVETMPVSGGPARQSNARQLSRWTGTINDNQTFQGSQLGHATLSVQFRGDVGPVYLTPDGTLQPNGGAGPWKSPIDNTLLNALKETTSSTCAVTAGGSFTQSDGTRYSYVYSGPSTLPVQLTGNQQNYFTVVLGAPSQPGPGAFRFQALANNALTVTITAPDGTKTTTVTNQIFQTIRDAGNVNHGDAITQFDSQYNMSSGTLNNDPNEVVTWSAFPCASPPDLTRAR